MSNEQQDDRGTDTSSETFERPGVRSITTESGQHYFNSNPAVKIKLHTPEKFELDVWSILEEAGQLLLSKHADYGPTNISRSPGGPINGLRVRMWDKIARINNLVDSKQDPKHESLRDSFIDLLNYSAIALLVLEGKWPNE